MNNNATNALTITPLNVLQTTPPGSPEAAHATTPDASPHTPTGAAHAILQAAVPPPIHGHQQNAFHVGSPAVHTHALWATPDWINGAAIGANMLNLTPLADAILPGPQFWGQLPHVPDTHPEHPAFMPPAFAAPAGFAHPAFANPAFVNDVPPQQAGGGLGDLAAFFPAIAPVNTHLPAPVMAPGTPLVDAAGNITQGLAHPFQTPSPQARIPATPRAGGRPGAFRGALLPLFERISRRDAQAAAEQAWQIANADILPQTPTPAGDAQPVFASPDAATVPVYASDSAAASADAVEASLPGQQGEGPSLPASDQAGPSNWWQR